MRLSMLHDLENYSVQIILTEFQEYFVRRYCNRILTKNIAEIFGVLYLKTIRFVREKNLLKTKEYC